MLFTLDDSAAQYDRYHYSGEAGVVAAEIEILKVVSDLVVVETVGPNFAAAVAVPTLVAAVLVDPILAAIEDVAIHFAVFVDSTPPVFGTGTVVA